MYVIKNFKEMFFKNRTLDRAVKPLKPIERFERPIGAWPFTKKILPPSPSRYDITGVTILFASNAKK